MSTPRTSPPKPERDPAEHATGISNRESAREEQRERESFPPEDPRRPPEDAAGRVGDAEPDTGERQTSHKAGSRSIAQKEDEARYPDRPMPASKAVPGAFGKEPPDVPAEAPEE